MQILLTGATGFVGRALLLRLLRDGHRVSALVRDPARARGLLGADVALVAADDAAALADAMVACDGVINLAGEPVLGKRWTSRRREALQDSRIALTRRVVEAMAAAPSRARTLISASAVGYYGDRGADRLTEESAPGVGFLAELCQDWEREAHRASEHGVRVCLARIGIVLGRDGGALAELATPFRLGLGGPLGGGAQYLPWIHLHDVVEALATAVIDPRWSGPINLTAPTPVPQRELAHALGRTLRRPAVFPLPGVALRLRFGAAAGVLLASQRAVPARLAELGFRFAHPELDGALAEVLGPTPGVTIERLGAGTPKPSLHDGSSTYLTRRRPRYLLRAQTTIELPREQVFEFFSRPANLGLITPRAMAFELTGPPPTMADAIVIDYRIKLGWVPLRWRTRIESWRPAAGFVDSQERGPYRAWWHEHHFHADGDRTIMEDRVYYAPPFGILGRIVHALVIRATLRQIFGHRAAAILLRFGPAGPSAATAAASAAVPGSAQRSPSTILGDAARSVPGGR